MGGWVGVVGCRYMTKSNKGDYIEPRFMISAFNCPHCNAYSHQKWGEIFFNNYQDNGPGFEHINDRILDFYKYFFAAICGRCSNYSIWNSRTKKVGDKSAARVYPRILTSLAPNQYMPDSAKGLYEEARMISGDSPRAAATLLRCAVEKVLDHLKIKKDNLYNRIGILVERKDLPETVYNALDIVRITGNDGAHSSQQIDMSGKDGKGNCR